MVSVSLLVPSSLVTGRRVEDQLQFHRYVLGLFSPPFFLRRVTKRSKVKVVCTRVKKVDGEDRRG